MDKKTFIEQIAMKHNKEKAEVARWVDIFLPAITASLAEGKSLQFRGYFSLNVSKRAAKICRNFQTNELMEIKPRKVVKFSPGQGLQRLLKKV